MEKRYTLPVAHRAGGGTVIGSACSSRPKLFPYEDRREFGLLSIPAFIIMGVVMIISACTFGVVAQSHEGVGGSGGLRQCLPAGKVVQLILRWVGSWPSSTTLPGVSC